MIVPIAGAAFNQMGRYYQNGDWALFMYGVFTTNIGLVLCTQLCHKSRAAPAVLPEVAFKYSLPLTEELLYQLCVSTQLITVKMMPLMLEGIMVEFLTSSGPH